MARLSFVITAAFAARALAGDGGSCPGPSSVDTHCPTVTSTGTLCGACPLRECFAMSTISNPCDCKSPVPTVTVNYPCGPRGKPDKCPPGCATTSYAYATSTSSCPGQPPPTTGPTVTSTIKQCPTVTSTLGVCSTCIRPMCMAISTVSLDCDCAMSIPTVYASYPCTGRCPGGCAGTEYVYATHTPVCSSPTPGSCVPTVTVSKCATPAPDPFFCIRDNFLLLPCGCATVLSLYTETVTVKTTPCTECHTAWPFTTTTGCPKQTNG